ncbi:MAG TPA: SGNH/GDSL hydrolase family protein [Pirellulales bacterium]|jgi:hypothetical protein
MSNRQLGYHIFFVAACSLAPFWQATAQGASIIGVAAMGASETEGTTYDGSWVPYLANDRGLNFGLDQSYNVAKGGSDSADLLAEGQDTKVASLVSQGKVNLAYLTIGGLDFPPVATQIATHQLNIPAFVAQVTGNITTAVNTVTSAGPTNMIVLSVPDMTLTGGGQSLLTTPAQRAPFLNVINQVNATLEPEILGRGLVYVDFAGFMRQESSQPLVIGGVTIDTKNEGTSPDHLWLNDLHVATVGNALFANLMLSAINKSYHLNYPLFTDQYILNKAGLSGYTGETSHIDYASFVHLPVPEPATIGLAITGAASLLLFARSSRSRQGRR